MPAILPDPLMAVIVDLVADENAAPSITRISDDETSDKLAQYMTWAKQYFKVRPSFAQAIVFSQCMNREVTAFLLRAGSLR